MFVSMTRARRTANGVMTPPPLHHWMEAVLLLCVSLVQGAASTLKMIFVRKTRDWHTGSAREALPQATSSNPTPGTNIGPPGSRPAVDAQRRTHSTQRDGGGLSIRTPVIPAEARHPGLDPGEELEPRSDTLALSPLMPTHVGIQGRPRPLSRLAASRQRTHHNRSGIPASAGMSGALRGKLRAKSA